MRALARWLRQPVEVERWLYVVVWAALVLNGFTVVSGLLL